MTSARTTTTTANAAAAAAAGTTATTTTTTEMHACRFRALELHRLGFQTALETMVMQDPELDVKERSKTALFQLRELIGNDHGTGNGSGGNGD